MIINRDLHASNLNFKCKLLRGSTVAVKKDYKLISYNGDYFRLHIFYTIDFTKKK